MNKLKLKKTGKEVKMGEQLIKVVELFGILVPIAQIEINKTTLPDLIKRGIIVAEGSDSDIDITIEGAVQHLANFDIVVGSKALAEASKTFGEPDDIYLLQDILEDVEDYDYIFIDNAPARSPLLYMSYVVSDYIIAPAECDDGALEGLRELGTDINRFKKRRQTHVQVLGLLLNKSENTVMHNLAYEEMQEIGQELGCTPFQTTIRKSITVAEAKAARQSINEYAKGNNSAKDYKKLMKEIEKRIQKIEEEK